MGRFGAKRSCLAGVKRGEPESDYLLSCRNVLGRMNLADNNEISTMLLNSLRSSDGIKLRRRVVFSPQTLQPIAQIVSENNHTYYNLKNSYRMLSMALDELPLLVNGRKLEEMIKRQKLDEYSRLRPVNQNIFPRQCRGKSSDG